MRFVDPRDREPTGTSWPTGRPAMVSDRLGYPPEVGDEAWANIPEPIQQRILRAAQGETTPIADEVGPVPHMLPEPLDRRLRSEQCLRGEPCDVPGCLCVCHRGDFPDARMTWVMSALDRIINQGPGSWNGFEDHSSYNEGPA